MGLKIVKPSKFARFVLYPLGAVIFVFIFIFVAMIAKGYRFEYINGKIVAEKTGMVIVATRPGEAKITLDNKNRKNTTFPFLPVKINNLLSGSHKLTLTKDGYRTWENTIKIQENFVTWVNYVLLFPVDLKIGKVDVLEGKKVITQGANNRYLFVSQLENNLSNYYLYDISNNNLTKIWPKKNSTVEEIQSNLTFDSAEFSENNDKLILKSVKDGLPNYQVLNTSDTEGKIISLTSFFGTSFDRIEVDPTDSSYVFAISKGNLYRLSLQNPIIPNPLVVNVQDFKAEKNRQVYFVQTENTTTALKSISYDGTRTDIIDSAILKNNKYKFSYSTSENSLLYYGNEEKILRAYLTVNNKMSSVDLGKNVTDFNWSPNGRYLYYYSGNSLHQYDWEKQKEVVSQIAGEIKNIDWFYDENHFLITTDKELFEIDLDNTNKVVLSSTPDKFFLDSRLSSIIFTKDGLTYNRFNGNF